MKDVITYEEALEIAKERNDKVNVVEEYADAWYFSYDDGEMHIGGSSTGVIVLKQEGKILFPYEYFMSDKYKVVKIKEERPI